VTEINLFGTIALAATTLYVRDLDAAVAWYRDNLGLSPMVVGRDAHAYSAYQLGPSILVLEPIEAALEPAPPGSESTTVNLVIDRDPNEVREELIKRGVSCGPIVTSSFHSFLMRDLDGNRFYVTRPITQEAQEQLEATVGDARA
jgi:catechol 2,3-dioxygenase-like lactoylglutathione lyase family enzyme